MSTTVPPPGSPNPMRGATTGIPVRALKRHVYRPSNRPRQPGAGPSTPRKAHRLVRPVRNHGDAAAEGPAPRAAPCDPEAVRARLRPALHEPERRGAKGGGMAGDPGLRNRECGSSAPDRGRPVPGLRRPRADRGRRTRFAEGRMAGPPSPNRQGIRGHRGRPRGVSGSQGLRSRQGRSLAGALDSSRAGLMIHDRWAGAPSVTESPRKSRGSAASQRISKTKETIEGRVATEPNTANARTTVKPRFLNDENVVTATRSAQGIRSARVSRNTTPPRRKVRPNEKRARDAMSSGWANNGPRVEPAVATTRKKNEMLTALPRKSTTRGNRRRNRDATSGTPINRTVCETSSPNGADRFVKTRVIAGTSPRPSTYRRAKAITALRVSPLRMEVIGTTAIAGGTAAMRTQPFRI